jgi:hypothetical protein
MQGDKWMHAFWQKCALTGCWLSTAASPRTAFEVPDSLQALLLVLVSVNRYYIHTLAAPNSRTAATTCFNHHL